MHQRGDRSARRTMTAVAAVIGALGVLIGAFGAHGLESYLTERFELSAETLARRSEQFDVGVRYHLVHAAAMLALCGLPQLSTGSFKVAAALMLAGTLLFSGSLYLLVATNTTWLGMITPLGGISWIIAWMVIAIGTLRSPEPEQQPG
jgi:uncharacterized membrane protein YgdD (TMEM256/DUF423 family)